MKPYFDTNHAAGRSDSDWIVAEETRCQVESLDLPVDLIAHRAGEPRRRRASSWET